MFANTRGSSAAEAIDRDTAVIVCSGPSIDALRPRAWRDIARAAEVVAVNGALAAAACLEQRVRFTIAAAHDGLEILGSGIPRMREIWLSTPAWRITRFENTPHTDAESYIDRADDWSDNPHACLHIGASAATVANWLSNPWPAGDFVTHPKRRPRRGLRKFVFVGLDMSPRNGHHARGGGAYLSGFASDDEKYDEIVCGWRRFHDAARARGIVVLNLTPGTALDAIPAAAPPRGWIRV